MMIFLRKLWVWIKLYWYVPLIIFAGVLFFLLGSKDSLDNVKDVMDLRKTSYKREVELIEVFHEIEREEKEKSKKKYLETLDEIESTYNVAKKEVTRKQKKKIKELVKSYEKDSSSVAKEIADEMGWEYVE